MPFAPSPMPFPSMISRIRSGFVAGTVAALALAALFYVLLAAGVGDTPGFVGTFRFTFGEHGLIDHALGLALYAVSGGIWGALYAWLVPRNAVWKAMLFGIVPTLWFGTAVLGATGKPLFLGGDPTKLAMSLVYNCLIWGGVLGLILARRQDDAAVRRP